MTDPTFPYTITGVLGEGATSVVHRAVDAAGREVAVKRLVPRDEAARAMFEHERWNMQRLDHPGLVRLLAHGEDAAGPWLAMELVAGDPAPAGPLAPDALRALLVPLVGAVGHLHGRGLVHGDLKPENVRLDAEGRPRLLDLGFLQAAGRPGLRRGTPAYMAPEVIRGEPADPRSDLYALGAMAYAWLVGRQPFQLPQEPTHGDALAIARAHLHDAPPDPLALAPGADPAIAAAVMACLAKDPGDRPATTAHLLALLGAGDAGEAYLVFGADLVGREEARAALAAAVAAQLAGQGPAAVVVGPAGMGRSRLLLEAAASPDGRAAQVLRVAGRGDRPHLLATDLLLEAEPLLPAAGRGPGDEAWRALRALVPRWGQPPEALDAPGHEARLRQALVALLAALAGAGPLVVAIDDWDQADEASRALLGPLLARPPVAGLAFALAVREGGPEPVPAGATVIPAGPLPPDAIATIAAVVLGEAPDPALARALTDLAAGSPAAARDLLAAWHAGGALARAGGAWRFDADAAATLAAGVADAARAALARVSPAARAVAGAAAVLGAAFPLAGLAALAEALPGLPAAGPGAWVGPLAELEAAGLVARTGAEARFVGTAHAAARELPEPALARALHARAARYFAPGYDEDRPDHGVDRLDLGGHTAAARHLLAAGDPAGVAAAIAAARRNVEAGALGTARALLAAAAAHPAAAGLPAARQGELARLLGDVARFRGEAEAAIGHYEAAIAIADEAHDRPAQARERVSAARAAMTLSQGDRARAFVEAALPHVRALGDLALEARAIMTVGRLDFFAGRQAEAVAAYERALALAEAARAPMLRAWALGFLGVMLPPADPRSGAYLAEAIALCRAHQDPLGLIEASNNLGDRKLAAGDPAGAEAVLAEALATCRQVGSAHEEAFVRLNLAGARLELGRLAEALADAKAVHALATHLGQPFPAGYALVFGALAATERGAYAEAGAMLDEADAIAARIGATYLAAACELGRGAWALERGDPDAAAAALAAARASHEALGDPVGVARVDVLRGRLLALRGDRAAARELLADARARAAADGARMRELEARLAEGWLALQGPDGDAAAAATTTEAPLPTATLAQTHAEAAVALAEAIGARTALAEARWQLGELRRLAGAPAAAAAHYEAAAALAHEAGAAPREALALVGLARVATGARAAEARAAGERTLRALAAEAGPGFRLWPERAAALAMAAPTGPAPGLAEAVGLLADLQAAGSARDLLRRALDRMMGLAGAGAGALAAFRDQQLDAHAVAFLPEETLFEGGVLDQALWYGEATFGEAAWSLPVMARGEVVAVLYLEGAEPARQDALAALAEPLGFVIDQFYRLLAFQAGADRLAFAADLAKAALAAPDRAALLDDLLGRTTRALHAERALLVRLDADEPALAHGVDAAGRRLPADAPFSRSVCRHVRDTGEGVRLFDPANMEGWQQQHSILALGLQTLVAVPVAVAGAPWGVLYADSTDVARMLGDREQALLAVAAEVLGLALARG